MKMIRRWLYFRKIRKEHAEYLRVETVLIVLRAMGYHVTPFDDGKGLDHDGLARALHGRKFTR